MDDVLEHNESKVYLHTKTETEAHTVRTKRHKEKNSIWNCHSCDINFRYMEELKEHALETHQSNKFLQCRFCDFATNLNESLKRHENIHTKEKQFPCHMCSKVCFDISDLKSHMNSHTDINDSVVCDICSKQLKSSYHLKKHTRRKHTIKADTEEQEYICEICSSVLKEKTYLRRHMKNVHGDYNFMCLHCDKRFKSNTHLQEHEKLHLGLIETVFCNVCAFEVRGGERKLKSHMKTHTNENSSLRCDLCEYRFRSQIYLIQHLDIAHKR